MATLLAEVVGLNLGQDVPLVYLLTQANGLLAGPALARWCPCFSHSPPITDIFLHLYFTASRRVPAMEQFPKLIGRAQGEDAGGKEGRDHTPIVAIHPSVCIRKERPRAQGAAD